MTARAQKIEAIRRLPQELVSAVEGLNEEQLNTPYRKGGWTPRQIVHHIADSHMNAFIRMKLILAEDHPTLKPYDQDMWARASDYTGSIDPSLAIVSGLHTRMAQLFESANDAQWKRSGYHPEREENITLEDLLDTYVEHGKHHVHQILSVAK
ncbi:MAG TPA: putative metal-dependent hydrolase [Candidatus Kapabacteria bacterium]|jgi:hypothetical protein|nr:putative metal-dependent hydrolase [Candidatus Kapabacteria bacterium]